MTSHNWAFARLGEFIETNSESYSEKEKWDYINYLDTGNITDNCIDEIIKLDVGVDKIPSRAKRKVKAGDVVISTVRPNQRHFGIIKSPPPNFLVSTGFTTIRANYEKASSDFVFWYLSQSSIVEYLQGIGETSASAYPAIKPSDIENLELFVPPLKEQKAIASVLGALDDKIGNNRRMNETLEEMARAIFKSWFVDFDPVRAKAEEKQPVHMDAETAALFPLTFGDDGLPMGWAWHKMGDCVSLTKGRSYKSVELQESDTALVTLKSFLRGGGYRADGLKAYTGKYKDEQTLVSGDLVVALTDVTQEADVIGKPAIVRSDGTFKTLVASLDVGVLRPIVPSISIPFLYCMMMTNDFQAHIYGHTSGTTVLHLGKEGVPKYKFPMPSNEVIARFTAIAEPIFSKIELNENNSNTLAKMRDTLLPKLMNGEIRVKDAEQEVEAIA